MRSSIRNLVPILVFTIATFPASSSAQEIRYALFRLPPLTPMDPHSSPNAVNSLGQVSGAANTFTSDLHATMWNGTDVLDLGAFGGDNSSAHGINDLGEAVGWSGRGPSDGRAFLWRDNQLNDLGALGGPYSAAFGINNLTQVVGWAGNDRGSNDAFIWEQGEMRALPGLPGGDGAIAYDINEGGQVVGMAADDRGSQWTALWDNDQLTVLPNLGRNPSVALAINDNGQAIGQSENSSLKTRAAAWVNGQVFDLHRNGLGEHSSAWGINNLGQVVGWVGAPPTAAKGFIWTQGAGMQILDPMVPPRLRENWKITFARDINDAGQIAAQGVVQGRPLTLYAFLLSPVQSTMELAAPSPGSAGETNTLTVTNATPAARVTFLYSRFGGGQSIPGCDLQQNALQLDSPTVIGAAIADASGVATITRTVPPIARNQTILFQAVVQNECAISQLVVHRFE